MESEWLSVTEAARKAGCSVDTIRRRIKRGDVRSREKIGPHGRSWEVCIDGQALALPATQISRPSLDTLELLRLLEAQQARIESLSAENGFLRGQLETRRELEAAREQHSVSVSRWWRFW